MVIHQGEVYWLDLRSPIGSEPGYRRPCVVIQNDLFNASRIQTVLVCPLTTNLHQAASPGNVLLENDEAGLPRQSVVNVSQLIAADRDTFGQFVGTLSAHRVRQILDGIRLVLEPMEV